MCCTKRWLGVREGVVFSKVSSFALHGRAIVTVGLNCCALQKIFIISQVFFHQSGQSPKIIRAKGVGLERTDSQTVGEFPRGRRKGRYSTMPLCIWKLSILWPVQTLLHLDSLHVVSSVLWDFCSFSSLLVLKRFIVWKPESIKVYLNTYSYPNRFKNITWVSELLL